MSLFVPLLEFNLLRRNHQVHRGTLHCGAPARRVLANYFADSHRVTGLLSDGPDLEFRLGAGCSRSVQSQPLHVGHGRYITLFKEAYLLAAEKGTAGAHEGP